MAYMGCTNKIVSPWTLGFTRLRRGDPICIRVRSGALGLRRARRVLPIAFFTRLTSSPKPWFWMALRRRKVLAVVLLVLAIAGVAAIALVHHVVASRSQTLHSEAYGARRVNSRRSRHLAFEDRSMLDQCRKGCQQFVGLPTGSAS